MMLVSFHPYPVRVSFAQSRADTFDEPSKVAASYAFVLYIDVHFLPAAVYGLRPLVRFSLSHPDMYVVGFVGSICCSRHSISLLRVTFLHLSTVYILEWAQAHSLLSIITCQMQKKIRRPHDCWGLNAGVPSVGIFCTESS